VVVETVVVGEGSRLAVWRERCPKAPPRLWDQLVLVGTELQGSSARIRVNHSLTGLNLVVVITPLILLLLLPPLQPLLLLLLLPPAVAVAASLIESTGSSTSTTSRIAVIANSDLKEDFNSLCKNG
jgi:hypothetical protein